MSENHTLFDSLGIFAKNLFTNAGKKIKTYAKVMFWIDTAIAIIAGLAICGDAYGDGEEIAIGISLIIGGPLFAWVVTLFMYGFGEIVDRICSLEQVLVSPSTNSVETTENENTVNAKRASVAQASEAPTTAASDTVAAVSDDTAAAAGVNSQETKRRVCPSCGKVVASHYVFCTKCGHKFD